MNINLLPDDLLTRVFRFLTSDQLTRVSQVNRRFRRCSFDLIEETGGLLVTDLPVLQSCRHPVCSTTKNAVFAEHLPFGGVERQPWMCRFYNFRFDFFDKVHRHFDSSDVIALVESRPKPERLSLGAVCAENSFYFYVVNSVEIHLKCLRIDVTLLSAKVMRTIFESTMLSFLELYGRFSGAKLATINSLWADIEEIILNVNNSNFPVAVQQAGADVLNFRMSVLKLRVASVKVLRKLLWLGVELDKLQHLEILWNEVEESLVVVERELLVLSQLKFLKLELCDHINCLASFDLPSLKRIEIILRKASDIFFRHYLFDLINLVPIYNLNVLRIQILNHPENRMCSVSDFGVIFEISWSEKQKVAQQLLEIHKKNPAISWEFVFVASLKEADEWKRIIKLGENQLLNGSIRCDQDNLFSWATLERLEIAKLMPLANRQSSESNHRLTATTLVTLKLNCLSNEHATTTPNLSSLPDKLLTDRVFQHLKPKQLLSISRVNQQFCRCALSSIKTRLKFDLNLSGLYFKRRADSTYTTPGNCQHVECMQLKNSILGCHFSCAYNKFHLHKSDTGKILFEQLTYPTPERVSLGLVRCTDEEWNRMVNLIGRRVKCLSLVVSRFITVEMLNTLFNSAEELRFLQLSGSFSKVDFSVFARLKSIREIWLDLNHLIALFEEINFMPLNDHLPLLGIKTRAIETLFLLRARKVRVYQLKRLELYDIATEIYELSNDKLLQINSKVVVIWFYLEILSSFKMTQLEHLKLTFTDETKLVLSRQRLAKLLRLTAVRHLNPVYFKYQLIFMIRSSSNKKQRLINILMAINDLIPEVESNWSANKRCDASTWKQVMGFQESFLTGRSVVDGVKRNNLEVLMQGFIDDVADFVNVFNQPDTVSINSCAVSFTDGLPDQRPPSVGEAKPLEKHTCISDLLDELLARNVFQHLPVESLSTLKGVSRKFQQCAEEACERFKLRDWRSASIDIINPIIDSFLFCKQEQCHRLTNEQLIFGQPASYYKEFPDIRLLNGRLETESVPLKCLSLGWFECRNPLQHQPQWDKLIDSVAEHLICLRFAVQNSISGPMMAKLFQAAVNLKYLDINVYHIDGAKLKAFEAVSDDIEELWLSVIGLKGRDEKSLTEAVEQSSADVLNRRIDVLGLRLSYDCFVQLIKVGVELNKLKRLEIYVKPDQMLTDAMPQLIELKIRLAGLIEVEDSIKSFDGIDIPSVRKLDIFLTTSRCYNRFWSSHFFKLIDSLSLDQLKKFRVQLPLTIRSIEQQTDGKVVCRNDSLKQRVVSRIVEIRRDNPEVEWQIKLQVDPTSDEVVEEVRDWLRVLEAEDTFNQLVEMRFYDLHIEKDSNVDLSLLPKRPGIRLSHDNLEEKIDRLRNYLDNSETCKAYMTIEIRRSREERRLQKMIVNLPDEILRMIFDYLEPKRMLLVSSACRKFYYRISEVQKTQFGSDEDNYNFDQRQQVFHLPLSCGHVDCTRTGISGLRKGSSEETSTADLVDGRELLEMAGSYPTPECIFLGLIDCHEYEWDNFIKLIGSNLKCLTLVVQNWITPRMMIKLFTVAVNLRYIHLYGNFFGSKLLALEAVSENIRQFCLTILSGGVPNSTGLRVLNRRLPKLKLRLLNVGDLLKLKVNGVRIDQLEELDVFDFDTQHRLETPIVLNKLKVMKSPVGCLNYIETPALQQLEVFNSEYQFNSQESSFCKNMPNLINLKVDADYFDHFKAPSLKHLNLNINCGYREFWRAKIFQLINQMPLHSLTSVSMMKSQVDRDDVSGGQMVGILQHQKQQIVSRLVAIRMQVNSQLNWTFHFITSLAEAFDWQSVMLDTNENRCLNAEISWRIRESTLNLPATFRVILKTNLEHFEQQHQNF